MRPQELLLDAIGELPPARADILYAGSGNDHKNAGAGLRWWPIVAQCVAL